MQRILLLLYGMFVGFKGMFLFSDDFVGTFLGFSFGFHWVVCQFWGFHKVFYWVCLSGDLLWYFFGSLGVSSALSLVSPWYSSSSSAPWARVLLLEKREEEGPTIDVVLVSQGNPLSLGFAY